MIPLWSAGVSWKVAQEPFYKLSFLPQLTFRMTYGFSGNVDNTLSALTTIDRYSATNQFTNLPYSGVLNFPNPDLRWEKVGQFNIGLDFASKGNRINGTIDYYRKKSEDVLAARLLDPTVGITSQVTNSANLSGGGLDLVLNGVLIDRNVFKWNASLLFSEVSYKVTRFLYPEQADRGYVSNGDDITPIKGYNPFLVVSYKWAGLDPANGDPRGLINGTLSNNYIALTLSAPFANQVISGSALPAYFGSLFNTLTWKAFSISANIRYKFNYFFRRPTVNYSSILSNLVVHPDYLLRWQKPGDEKWTNVPSFIYPNPNSYRDVFYANSELTVEKGDHIRLDDIKLAYTMNRTLNRKLPVKQLQLYGYFTNLNVLIWKASHSGLDPDYISGLKPSLSMALGIKAEF